MTDTTKPFTRPLLFGTFAAAGIAAGLFAALLVDHESRAVLLSALESLADATECKAE